METYMKIVTDSAGSLTLGRKEDIIKLVYSDIFDSGRNFNLDFYHTNEVKLFVDRVTNVLREYMSGNKEVKEEYKGVTLRMIGEQNLEYILTYKNIVFDVTEMKVRVSVMIEVLKVLSAMNYVIRGIIVPV